MFGHAKPMLRNLIQDSVEINTLFDVFGGGGATEVGNLLLEDNANYLLEDGSFILIE